MKKAGVMGEGDGARSGQGRWSSCTDFDTDSICEDRLWLPKACRCEYWRKVVLLDANHRVGSHTVPRPAGQGGDVKLNKISSQITQNKVRGSTR